MTGRLLRYEDTETALFGIIMVGDLVLHSLERLWADNQPFVSCFPDGDYQLVPWKSPSKNRHIEGRCLKIIGVEPKRTDCLVHTANCGFELQGCVAPGTGRGRLAIKGEPEQDAVLNSTVAMKKLLRAVTRPIPFEVRTAATILQKRED